MIKITTQYLDASEDLTVRNMFNGIHYLHPADGNVTLDQNIYISDTITAYERLFGELWPHTIPWRDLKNE